MPVKRKESTASVIQDKGGNQGHRYRGESDVADSMSDQSLISHKMAAESFWEPKFDSSCP